MERFESLLAQRGIEIVSQYASGSGDVVHLVLRVPDDSRDLDLAFSLEALVEQPDASIRQVDAMIERRREQRRAGNGQAPAV